MGNYLNKGKFPDWVSDPKYIVVVAVGGIVIYKLLRKSKSLFASSNSSNYPNDTVVLHQIGRGPWAPSMTPFAIKLETFLRMANIPYVNIHGDKASSKGKVPWMEYNGESIADSQFCIEYLKKKLNIDMNNHLTAEQKGIGRAFQKMSEENTYWAWVLFRWYYDKDMKALSGLQLPLWMTYMIWLIKPVFRREIKKTANAQGMGRHTQDEVHHIMMGDLQALSDYLGSKKFLFGDKACEMDCAIFGQLSQMYWHMYGNPPETAIKKFPNLCKYLQTMKDTFWPDWEDCITHGGTRTATK